jgi:hypothetical protein
MEPAVTALLPRVVLTCDDSGDWTLSEQGAAARRFPDFEAALHCVRRAPRTQSATIEVWERGEYVCCLPPGAWPHCRVAEEAVPVANEPALAVAERWANRIGRFLLSTAGPAFWIVVLAAAVVASLGWRVVLL